MASQSESRLLRKAQAGDDDAFGQLQQRLEPEVRRFIWRLIGGRDAVDDIIQDSFLSLYVNRNRVHPLNKLRPYLFRIVRNRCYDELRRQGRYDLLSLDDEPVETWVSAQVAPTAQTPEEMAHWLLLHLEVQEAIDRLPENQRQTLILYTEHDLSYSEIAAAMNTSIGTVKSRLFYAKKTLRQLIHPDTLALLDDEFGEGKQHEPELSGYGRPSATQAADAASRIGEAADRDADDGLSSDPLPAVAGESWGDHDRLRDQA
ncbi:MAG: RNA polymerase sigma factor [Anaerolineaceae bacterium]|nr:RNA polymerase sigma factor [Anaerolineaceae bacterium]